jgi:transposase
MSLAPHPDYPIPEETLRVAQAAFPRPSRFMQMRDQLGTIYDDAAFGALYPHRGQPAEAPWRLALVTIMQFADALTDRQAADAVRSRIDWKYALGLELTDAGFHYSVLSKFRTRLVTGRAEQMLLDVMLTRFQACGLLKAGGRARTDSTHIVAAIRALNRLECVGETLRAALHDLATVAPDWLRQQVTADWFERYGTRIEESRLPKGEAQRYAYAEQIGADGLQLLGAIYHDTAPRWLREIPTVDILRQTWVHQYYTDEEGHLRWRQAQDLPPAGMRMDSPYDPDAHFGNKRSITWTGYKVHVTETCDDATLHVITHVETTEAAVTDVTMTEPIQQALNDKQVAPDEHIVDAGYVDATLLVQSPRDFHLALIGPVPTDNSWQAKAEHAYDLSQFHIDWEAQQVTCPRGKTSSSWSARRDRWNNPVISVKFAYKDCRYCEARRQCTKAKTNPRHMTLKPRDEHQALQALRQQQNTSEWKAKYAKRAGVEGTLSQGVRAFGLRHCRYVGLAKTRLQHLATAAAINIDRLAAWLDGRPHSKTRTSRFAALAA